MWFILFYIQAEFAGGACHEDDEGTPCQFDENAICADKTCFCLPDTHYRGGKCIKGTMWWTYNWITTVRKKVSLIVWNAQHSCITSSSANEPFACLYCNARTTVTDLYVTGTTATEWTFAGNRTKAYLAREIKQQVIVVTSYVWSWTGILVRRLDAVTKLRTRMHCYSKKKTSFYWKKSQNINQNVYAVLLRCFRKYSKSCNLVSFVFEIFDYFVIKCMNIV